jgi:UDP-N-acetylmuramoylalanine--D-glutamate ligase
MKIAIAGYGVEGQSNYVYWAKDPSNELTIVDERAPEAIPNLPEGASVRSGTNVFSQLDDFDMVIRTAGLAPYKIHTNGKVWSATNEFFARCPAPIIGVTGTKGKGTTSSLIAAMLEAAGKKVWLVGNIGIPALDVLERIQPNDIVVYELSSFQLWDVEASPHIAVVLMIEQEHLDVHRSMEEYVGAKANIARWQTQNDVVIYTAENQYARSIAEASSAVAIPVPGTASAHLTDNDTQFAYGETVVAPVNALTLPGAHNVQNALAAIAAAWQITQDKAAITTGLTSFKGLPHRLAYVATVNDVAYYDDSIATTPGSAIAALHAFADRPKVIILGGSYKGSDFSELAHELTQQSQPTKALLIGDEAPRIAEALDTAGFSEYEHIEDATAERFTRRAAEIAEPGSVVLLSPSAASFGLFKNYVDRGEQFIAAVKAL